MVITDLCAARQQCMNPPTSSSLSTRCVLAAQQKEGKSQKNLQLGVIDPALIWQCFSMPCSLYDSMVYVTANGAHTDEWSVAYTHTQKHRRTKALVVKSTHRHSRPTPTACTVRMRSMISEEMKRQEQSEVRGSEGKQRCAAQAFSRAASSIR